jgi:hypothetical protein
VEAVRELRSSNMSKLFLPSPRVQGYRLFDDLSIERLGRVNLITGKNNTGKSALLEAVRLYAFRGAPHSFHGFGGSSMPLQILTLPRK